MSGEPWIEGRLRIPARVLREVEQHALEEYPKECCGFLSGPAADPHGITDAIRETNEADKYHKLDPETFPRTAEMYFKINELRASRAFEQGVSSGVPIKVIYHSHCDAGAYFSDEDAATFASEGQLMWPCSFLVVSLVSGKVEDRKLWVHVPGTNAFEESPFEVID